MGEEPDEMSGRLTDAAVPLTPDDPEVHRAQIEQTRADMSETIDAIQEKLSPQRIINEAKEGMREATVGRVKHMVTTASETASDLTERIQEGAEGAVETARDHPVVSVLIGAGVAWWLLRSRSRSTTTWSRTSTSPMRDRSTNAPQTRDSLRHYADRAESELARWMRTNPLAVGLSAAAAGAVVGLSLPRTQTEDRWLGDTRDTLVERAQDAAQETVQKVERATEQMQQPSGPTGQSPDRPSPLV